MPVYKVKATIKAAPGMVLENDPQWRGHFYTATGSYGSPAIKNLYQDGFISDYLDKEIVHTGNSSVQAEMSITYTLKDENSQDLFFMGNTDYKALTDEYKAALAEYGFELTAEKITE